MPPRQCDCAGDAAAPATRVKQASRSVVPDQSRVITNYTICGLAALAEQLLYHAFRSAMRRVEADAFQRQVRPALQDRSALGFVRCVEMRAMEGVEEAVDGSAEE